jgi:hypothetical protein
MLEIRPDLQPAYDLLCSQGQQFPEPHETIQLNGLYFTHPRKGEHPINIDREVLAMQGALYVGDPALRSALREQEIETKIWEDALTLLGSHLGSENDSLVWGFSGYATGGMDPVTGQPYSYHAEAEGLLRLYTHLADKNALPSLAVDGGVSEGFLALNSVVAQSAGVRTVGFLPEQGLGAAGVRDDLVVGGQTYEGREKAVATADVLLCAGGFKGTIRECIKAVKGGAAALLLDLKDYPDNSLPNVFHKDKDLREAFEDKRLVVCKNLDEIPECVDQLRQIDVKSSRPGRKKILTEFLTPKPL